MIAFWTGARASEILKLKRRNVTFEKDHEGRYLVYIKYELTKTKRAYKDDGHIVTFYQQDKSQKFAPYKLISDLCRDTVSGDNWIAPFGLGTYENRCRNFYAWFNSTKKAFQTEINREQGWNVDTTEWRFHSIRTTFIGFMRTKGASWDQIQFKCGHTFNSRTTKNTYFFNALMTKGYNQEFEKILQKDLDTQQLLGQDFTDQVQHDQKSVQHEK